MLLECAVCLNAYDAETRRPLSLPCGHCNCSPCVDQLKTHGSGTVTCPECRTEHRGGQDFPVNWPLLALIPEANAALPEHQPETAPVVDREQPTAGSLHLKIFNVSNGSTFFLDISQRSTVRALKTAIRASIPLDVEHMILLCSGHTLDESRELSALPYIRNNVPVHVVARCSGGKWRG